MPIKSPVLSLTSSKGSGNTTPVKAQRSETPNSQTSTPTLDDDYFIPESTSAPMSSSFTSYFSSSLPRKWTSLIRSPSSSSLPIHHSLHPAHVSTMPYMPSPSTPATPVTHESPFAAQPFTPPSGAPGKFEPHFTLACIYCASLLLISLYNRLASRRL